MAKRIQGKWSSFAQLFNDSIATDKRLIRMTINGRKKRRRIEGN
ncbi:MAG TPA: hypothetical protein PKA63_12635 [Oligoflexia bacterium]|nr:hypothetical protein [Oligoflexia bacterium]